ncbi:hypothetical protein ES703_34811 [subsurface metagenome]
MAIFMLDAGVRIGELVNLAICDLMVLYKPAATLNIVRGLSGGHFTRAIALSDRVRHCIGLMDDHWWRPDAGKPGNFAFYNQSAIKHIGARQFQRIVNNAALEALGYPVNPNALRQTCAARIIIRYGLAAAQKMLDYKTGQKSYFYPW